jgi:heptosyltransferase-1
MDILIIKLGALGDVVNTLPLAMALKKGLGARIYWLTAPLSHPLLEAHPAVDGVILFDIRKGIGGITTLWRHCRSRRFELVLDVQRILKSGLWGWAARGQRKIGFDRRRCKELTWLLPFERLPAGDSHAHMVHQYLEFAHYLGVSDKSVQWGLTASGHPPQGLPPRFVALNIGATKPANRWTVEGFTALALGIRSRYGLSCVLTGGREDVTMARGIEAATFGSVFNLADKTTLAELIDVLESSAAVVTCDTGPMHLAVALGKKVLALFGPSDHRRTGPYQGRVIRARVPCGPCGRKTCGRPDCMTAIKPEMELDALDAFLS